MKSISEVEGIFREYAEGKTADWEEVRNFTATAVAAEIADE